MDPGAGAVVFVSDNLLSDSTAMDEHATKAATKLATTFNTNRTYINEAARLKQGREKKKEEGKLYGRGNTKDEKVLSIIDTTFEEETHSTRKIIAEEIGKSTAPTLATIGRMPGRLQNKMMVGQ